MATRLDAADIQGLVVSAFGHLPCAAYRLLRVTDAGAARAWLRSFVDRVTTAERKQDHRSLNVAITFSGLQALGLGADALTTFPVAFREGMASPRRSRVLGDSAENDPAIWVWGGPTAVVDMAMLVYAEDEQELERQLNDDLAVVPGAGVIEVATLAAGRQPDNREHFGFMDGIGQPVIDGTGRETRQRRRTGHATVVPAGEFVLGYDNVYGTPSLMPTVPPADDPTHVLPLGTNGRGALGQNGSYLVFRQIAQDVAGFWQFATRTGRALWPADANAPLRFAAKCVGRWPSGAPLVTHPANDVPPGDERAKLENDFSYAPLDLHGTRCPLGAHIRRSNPRDSLGPDADQARASANRHRLMRRGRSYGHRLADPLVDDGKERGLHFICLNADLERQFEFVQQTWINNPVFAGLASETDPVIGNQVATGGAFSIPETPLRRRVSNLQQFTRMRGGAYFFLPGIRALRFLAGPLG